MFLFIAIFCTGELAALPIFQWIRNSFHPGSKHTALSITKGLLERLLIFIGLINNFPPVLAFFGAIKIATRLKDNEDKITNDYFLIGNFVSVLLSLLYSIIWLHAKN